jgi:predicted Zn-dependent protease
VGSALSRCALVVLALVVAAWLVLSYRAVELEDEGKAALSEAVGGDIAPAEITHGRDALERARRLNADKSPRLTEASLLMAAKRPDEAVVAAKRVLASEPDNVDAWIILHGAAQEAGDGKRATRALRRLRDLNPIAADEVGKR